MITYTLKRIIVTEDGPDVTVSTGLKLGDALRRYNGQANAYRQAPGRMYQELAKSPVSERGGAAVFYNGRATITLMLHPDEHQGDGR